MTLTTASGEATGTVAYARDGVAELGPHVGWELVVGHPIERSEEEAGLVRADAVLNHEELQAGDVSLAYVSRLLHRRFADAPTIRKVLQTLWYQVNSGQEIYVVGAILPDDTAREVFDKVTVADKELMEIKSPADGIVSISGDFYLDGGFTIR